jgi:soluble lytic murein transglycosylase-like protein
MRYHRFVKSLIVAAVLLIIGSIWYLVSDFADQTQPVPPWRVWREVQGQARAAAIDPGFVYAIIWAESSLRPDAQSNVARGLMQLTEEAWSMVNSRPYWQAWDWRINISVGIDYLKYCRERLESANQFSYPLLAASYRYGPNHVKEMGYDLNRIKKPDNPIYTALFAGEMRPVEPL